MWKRFAITAMACIIITLRPVAQVIQPLSIGDSLVTEKVFSMFNGKEILFPLSQAKEELILLDFWATWCTSCIVKFPKLDSLQHVFDGKLKVLLVNWDEDTTKIRSFLNKYAIKKGSLGLSIIAGDTVLRSLFPHQSIPHYAWIHNKKVIAVTGPEMIEAERIEKVLANLPVTFKMKKDVLDFNKDQFLFEEGNGGSIDRQLFRSVFTRELEGVRGGTRFVKDSMNQRAMYINFPVAALYQLAYGFDYNRLVLEVRDPLEYAGTAPVLYSYELTAPLDMGSDRLKDFMRADLDRYLGLKGRMEKRSAECYVLKKVPSVNANSDRGLVVGSKDGSGKMEVWEGEEGSMLHLRRMVFNVFVRDLNHSILQWPCKPIIVDETGYKGTISIDLPVAAREDMKVLKKVLLERGFVLEKTKRVVEVFVLREVSPGK